MWESAARVTRLYWSSQHLCYPSELCSWKRKTVLQIRICTSLLENSRAIKAWHCTKFCTAFIDKFSLPHLYWWNKEPSDPVFKRDSLKRLRKMSLFSPPAPPSCSSLPEYRSEDSHSHLGDSDSDASEDSAGKSSLFYHEIVKNYKNVSSMGLHVTPSCVLFRRTHVCCM